MATNVELNVVTAGISLDMPGNVLIEANLQPEAYLNYTASSRDGDTYHSGDDGLLLELSVELRRTLPTAYTVRRIVLTAPKLLPGNGATTRFDPQSLVFSEALPAGAAQYQIVLVGRLFLAPGSSVSWINPELHTVTPNIYATTAWEIRHFYSQIKLSQVRR